jgi:hypothetical protein
MKVFFYGVGFTACGLLLFIDYGILMERIIGLLVDISDRIPSDVYIIYALTAFILTLLYYSYAVSLQNNNDKKGISKGVFYLMILAFTSSATLFIFEVIKSHILFFGFPMFLGIGFVCFLIFSKVRIDLRWIAWGMFPSYPICLGLILTSPLV